MDTRQKLPNQMYITLLISLPLTELTFKFYWLESRLHFYQLLKKTLLILQQLIYKFYNFYHYLSLAWMLAPGGHWCGKKLEFPERNHVSK